MRLQTRLTLSSAALITAVSLSVGGASTYGAYQHEFDVARAALAADKAQIASADGQELTTALLLSYQQNLTIGLIDSAKVLTVVRDGEIPLRAKPSQVVLGAASGAAITRKTSDGTPYLLQSVRLANKEWLILQESMADAQKRYTAAVASLVLYTSIADILAVLLVALLIRRDLRGLRRIIRTARRIAGGGRDEFEVGKQVTEVGQLGEALKSMVQQLQANQVEMQRFLGDASHELRTPLTVIRGYLEMLGNPARSGDAAFTGRAVSVMSGEVARMQRLIEDLLLLTELGAAGRSLELAPVDLSALVRGQLELMHDLQPARPLTANVADGVLALGEGQLLDQLLANLFGNLRRHTGTNVLVEVGLRVEGSNALLTLDDAGPGLSAEAYARGVGFFERFDPSRSRENGGSGLGMSIMAGIVAKHGGQMTLEPSALGGLHTTIRLPLAGADN
jgi:signal transduction histidine kinase